MANDYVQKAYLQLRGVDGWGVTISGAKQESAIGGERTPGGWRRSCTTFNRTRLWTYG